MICKWVVFKTLMTWCCVSSRDYLQIKTMAITVRIVMTKMPHHPMKMNHLWTINFDLVKNLRAANHSSNGAIIWFMRATFMPSLLRSYSTRSLRFKLYLVVFARLSLYHYSAYFALSSLATTWHPIQLWMISWSSNYVIKMKHKSTEYQSIKLICFLT